MLRGGRNVCVRSRSRDHGGALKLDSGKKNHFGGVVGGGRRSEGVWVWVSERRSKRVRSCLGVTDLGITPYVDWTTDNGDIHAIG
jgi:hypothetical protein